MDQLVQVLRDSLSHDQTKLDNVSQFLSVISQQNLPWLLQCLLVIVSSKDVPPLERQQAGLQLKRLLCVSSYLPSSLRDGLRSRLIELIGLGCETWRPSTLGLCVQVMFEQEQEEEWTEIIPALVTNITNNQAVVASIETLGYLCSTESKKTFIEAHMDTILTGTIRCVNNTDLGIKLTGLGALVSCVECAAGNFARAHERDVILQAVCEATQTGSPQVTAVAMECLNKMVVFYYCLLEDYMAPALVPLSLCSLNSDQERLVMLGIEFWSCVCEQEERLAEDGNCAENTLEALLQHTGTADVLVDSLLEVIRGSPESDRDLQIWTRSSAALRCLSQLVGRSVKEVQNRIGDRIKENFNSGSWESRFTAIVSIGSLLGMENETDLLTIVSSFLSIAEALFSDPNRYIRLAAASVLDKLSDVSSLALVSDSLQYQFQSLCYGCILSEDQKIVELGCFSIGSFFRNMVSQNDSYFIKILLRLFVLTDCPGYLSGVHQTVFSTIVDLIEISPPSCHNILVEMASNIVLKMKISPDDNVASTTYLSLQCHTLNTLLCVIGPAEISNLKDDIFSVLPVLFHAEDLREDGLLLLRSLVAPLGPHLVQLLPSILALCLPYLQTLSGDQAHLCVFFIIQNLSYICIFIKSYFCTIEVA